MANVKQKRLEGIIRKNISDIIQFSLKDPNVGFVTITDVSVTNDHSYAKVYCSFLGKDERAAAGLKALNRAGRHTILAIIQGFLTHSLYMAVSSGCSADARKEGCISDIHP